MDIWVGFFGFRFRNIGPIYLFQNFRFGSDLGLTKYLNIKKYQKVFIFDSMRTTRKYSKILFKPKKTMILSLFIVFNIEFYELT